MIRTSVDTLKLTAYDLLNTSLIIPVKTYQCYITSFLFCHRAYTDIVQFRASLRALTSGLSISRGHVITGYTA